MFCTAAFACMSKMSALVVPINRKRESFGTVYHKQEYIELLEGDRLVGLHSHWPTYFLGMSVENCLILFF